MAYNLRSRVRDALLREDKPDDLGGNPSSDEEDNVSVESEEFSESEYSESEDLENMSLNQRLLYQREQAAQRGRPASTLVSKNKTKWKVGQRERTSGKHTFPAFSYFV